MEDFEVFQQAAGSDHSYSSTFAQSLSLALDEFYKNLRSVGVSAVSGTGIEAFFKTVETSAEEYMENYKYIVWAWQIFLFVSFSITLLLI